METLYDTTTENAGGVGLLLGLQTPERDRWGQLLAEPRPCQYCGMEFRPTVKDVKRRWAKFCSRKCHTDSRRGIRPSGLDKFITPESDKAQRIRANGIVNRRFRLGWFKKPTHCACCHQPAKVEFHHHDYSKPVEGRWICRSCHGRSHYAPEILDAVPIVTLNREGPPPKPHGRGGRKGPTGKAKGRCPLHRVASVTCNGDSTITEHLSCGHTFTRADDNRRVKQRRCPSCPRLTPHPTHPDRERTGPAAHGENGGAIVTLAHRRLVWEQQRSRVARPEGGAGC